MPEFTPDNVEFEVYCECGRELYTVENASDRTHNYRRTLTVEPCASCLEQARDEEVGDGD